jgi:Salmonella virulence plasmid 65kDa B protein
MLSPSTQEGNKPGTEGDKSYFATAPAVSLPKGGGAIKGMGEKFAANPVTGTGSMSVPIATSPRRGEFGPQLSLSYDSGAGNGMFGMGWSLSLPSITRKTDKGLPRYWDGAESDVFILSGAEDLVPKLRLGGSWMIFPLQVCVRFNPIVKLMVYLPKSSAERNSIRERRTGAKDNITTLYRHKYPDSKFVEDSDR